MLRNPKLVLSLLLSTHTHWNFIFEYWDALYAGTKFSGQGSITSFQLCFASLGGPLRTCMLFSTVSPQCAEASSPWHETYLDTTKLGKCPSGACGGCLAHHVLPVSCALAKPLPDSKATARAMGERLQDLASHSASSQVVSPWENHDGSPALAPSQSLGCLPF